MNKRIAVGLCAVLVAAGAALAQWPWYQPPKQWLNLSAVPSSLAAGTGTNYWPPVPLPSSATSVNCFGIAIGAANSAAGAGAITIGLASTLDGTFWFHTNDPLVVTGPTFTGAGNWVLSSTPFTNNLIQNYGILWVSNTAASGTATNIQAIETWLVGPPTQ